ncbi:Outer membrane protein HofH, putative signal peptide [Helicobacter pylori Rif2]|nr:Outer membrane protein HofH, putative signal peptide [Helicobacter pylori Rif2]
MKKASQVLFFGAFLSSSLQGFEAKLNGFVDQSSTIGFNQHKINKERVSTLCSNSQRLRAI